LLVAIPVVSPLIDLLLLRACPFNHGFPIVVISPILFPYCGSFDHDDLAFILVRVPSPTCLRSDCVSFHTCTLEWWIKFGPCHSLMPYAIRCMWFSICIIPHDFPATLTIERAFLPYPYLPFMLILHGNWWKSVRQSYPT
jgi:hypothetical protein